jgi:hypothetical protein
LKRKNQRDDSTAGPKINSDVCGSQADMVGQDCCINGKSIAFPFLNDLQSPIEQAIGGGKRLMIRD